MTSGIGSHGLGDHPDSGSLRRSRATIDDEDEDFGSKRQRTALACDSCRHRKSRCNGERPLCATCRHWGFECVYRGPAPGPKPPSKEMQSMADRLRHVEELLQTIVGSQEGYTNLDIATNTTSDLQSSASLHSRMNGDRAEQPSHHQQDDNMNNVWSTMNESTVDGMSSITFANESSSGYFGPSSNSAFIGYVARALASGAETLSDGRNSSRDLTSNMSRPASPPLPANRKGPEPINPYRLPPRAEILRLVDKFFSFTGHFFPYISKTSVLQMVDEVEITMFSGVRKSWVCLLNAILAIGTSLDVDSTRQTKFQEAESDVFFQRALALSPLTPSNTDNLETVQALAVMTQYLQGTSKSTQTWRLHGLLVQAAFQVGVHAKDVSEKRSAFEQESRARTWYTCVVLDKMLSMTFGRPALIHNELIQIDLPQDVELDSLPKDDAPHETAQHSSSGSSPCGIFIASINLYRIQGDMISKVYNHNVNSSRGLRSDELFSRIVALDYELTQWKRNLPLNIALLPLESLEGMEVENWAYTQTQTVLTIRYLNSRTLLFRKVLEHMLNQVANPESLLEDTDCMPPVGDAMVQTCTTMATYTITIIHKVRTRSDLLPAWWFTTYYAFNSAMVIFGVICLRTLSQSHASWKPLSELVACLKTALEAFDMIGGCSAIVRRCSKYLRKMIQVATLLALNQTPAQPMAVNGATTTDFLPCENLSTMTSENTLSPLQDDLGQLLVDGDFSFLDYWTDAAQQSNN